MITAKVVTILHPSSAVNNIVNDVSGNVAVGNNLTVAGTSTLVAGNVVDWPAHQAHEFIALEPGSRLVNLVKD